CARSTTVVAEGWYFDVW
nr:immunoglobulin heavy chain junction region [Mus musculus]